MDVNAAGNLYVEDFGGKGETLIFVHGLGGSTNTWYPQVQVLKRDLHVIAYDIAGAANSPMRDQLSIDTQVADLRGLAEKLAPTNGRVHLAGHSLGAIICQYLAVLKPKLVASLVLVGPFPEPPNDNARQALRTRAAKARTEGLQHIADAIVDAGTSSDTKINQPAAAVFVRESILRQPVEGYAKNCELLAELRSANLTQILCPVLLITGDQDRTAPPTVSRQIVTAIPHAEFRELTGCGHWATVERAKQVNYAMTLFHSRLKRSQRDAAP